jgi:predicted DNA-binding transcriptional regulator AlpA
MDELIDHHAVAQYLRVTTRTLRTWIRNGQVPKPIAIGRKQFWVKPVLDAWLSERAQRGCEQQPIKPSNVSRARRGRPRLPAQ